MDFVSFPSIEGFHNVVRLVKNYPHLVQGMVEYRGKIKLHGTNAGVRIADGNVAAQSRSQIITSLSDNAGFAKWVEKTDYFRSLKGNYTIFGEWCGPGIMKGTAINQIPNKQFVVFAILLPEPNLSDPLQAESLAPMIVDPDEISSMLGTIPDDMKILPWYGEKFAINFFDHDQLTRTVDYLNKEVEVVEPCDPWVKKTFGVDGMGEGIVYYPSSGETIVRKRFSDLAFKAKGEKHKVVNTKQPVQIDPEVVASVDEFVSMFVTEARLEQGLATLPSLDLKFTGDFLRWMGLDVLKESEAELERSNLSWDQVQKSVQQRSRNWFIGRVKQL